METSRRTFFKTGAAIGVAGGMALPGAANAAVAKSLPFKSLQPQASINLRADAYGESALRLSRLAAMTTRCELDIAYADKPATRLDIYMPDDESRRELPVFVNIHGGGWTYGYKEWMGLNAPPIVGFPAVYVSIEYTLAPASKHPQSLHECLTAIAWVHKNIRRYGGNPDRIHVGGHSAGAHLAALVTLRRDLYPQFGLPPAPVKSCFPYSGVYDLRDLSVYGQSNAQNPGNIFIARREDAADASPITFPPGNTTPFYVTWAENDNLLVKAQGPVFLNALRGASGRAEAYMFPLFDHFWIHVDQQRETNLWTRTLRAWMTGDPKDAPMPPA